MPGKVLLPLAECPATPPKWLAAKFGGPECHTCNEEKHD